LLGARRTPIRLVVALLTLMLAGIWLARAIAGEFSGAEVVGGVACLLAGTALKGLADGLHQVVDDANSPSTYGVTVAWLLLVHAVVPLIGGVVSLAIGGIAGLVGWESSLAALGDWAGGIVPGSGVDADAGLVLGGITLVAFLLVTAVVLAALAVAERAKGASPATLAVPAYTPMGDPAPVMRAAWQIWPQLTACGWGALVVWLAGAVQPAIALALPAGLAALVVFATIRRLHQL
jgi:hypothetical protein